MIMTSEDTVLNKNFLTNPAQHRSSAEHFQITIRNKQEDYSNTYFKEVKGEKIISMDERKSTNRNIAHSRNSM